jgi:hypothetical protein
MAVCNKTGAIAIYNQNLNLFLSPFSDGPIHFNTTLDGKMNIRNISRFGRSFSIVRIPYALKLLIQELQVMNVQMRIITEDNIDQLVNMSYSNNINELLKSKENLEELASSYKGMIYGKKRELYSKPVQKNVPKEVPEYPEIKMEETPEFKPVTPSFSPESPPFASEGQPNTDSPPFAPGSPAYNPNTDSPPFAPESPAYNPNTQQNTESPPFAPSSPAYNPNTESPPFAPGSQVVTPVVTNSPPYAPGTPTSQNGGAQPVNITLTIDDVSELKKMIDEKKEKEFEPIIFETKPKDPPKSIFDVDDVVKVDEDTSSSSSTSDTSSSSSGSKKVIIL